MERKKKYAEKRKLISVYFWDIASFVRESKQPFATQAFQDGNRKYEVSITITSKPEEAKEYLSPLESRYGALALHFVIEKERFVPIGPVYFHGLKFFIH